ncbi:MAG: SAM-dependent methyltransferase [Pseudomonadota bacterium]
MPAPPVIFDPAARQRAQRRADTQPVTFLDEAAQVEIEERLAEVNRAFQSPVVIGPRAAAWAARVLPGAETRPDLDALELEVGGHDLALHALALHAANDPVGQLIQMRRALRPDGLMLACLPAGRTLHELRSALAEAEAETRGGLSPRVAPMGEIRDLGALLQRAGFALPVADSVTLPVTYPDLRALFLDLRGMGETNILAARDRRIPPRRLFARAEALYRQAFGLPDGRLPATVELVFLTGWAPAETQPQPLRPGSAAMRLADALGTKEHDAGDPIDPGVRKGK